eukprot:6173057-Pleurochrysis_carterae.AAC.1
MLGRARDIGDSLNQCYVLLLSLLRFIAEHHTFGCTGTCVIFVRSLVGAQPVRKDSMLPAAVGVVEGRGCVPTTTVGLK